MTNELLSCPCCGGAAEIDSTAAAEIYGRAWQTVTIECCDSMDKACGMTLTITTDTSTVSNAWQVAIEAWKCLA